MPKSGPEGNHHLQRAGYTKQDRDPFPCEISVRVVAGIAQGFTRSDKTQKLGGIDRFKNIGLNIEFKRVEINRIEESTPVAIGVIRAFWVRVVVVRNPPMGLWNFTDSVHLVFDVGPIGGFVRRFGEQAADTYNRQRNGRSQRGG